MKIDEEEFNRFLDDVEGMPCVWHSKEQLEWGLDIARHFANWQKEQMMKDAVEAYAIPCDNEFICDFSKIPYFDNWEKVKLIIVKEG